MAPTKLLVLRLLIDNPKGLYGSEFVHLSDGKLNRGTVYVLLDRMTDEALVRKVGEPPSPQFKLARTRHLITAPGKKAYADFLADHGLKRA